MPGVQRNTTFTKTFIRKPGHRNDTSIPIHTEAPPPLRQPTRIARAKTLTRPERSQPQVPLINPSSGGPGFSAAAPSKGGFSWWTVFSLVVTFWAPSPLLRTCGGLKDSASRQAWREKVSLVFVALLLGAFIGFITMGLNAALCPSADSNSAKTYMRIGTGGAVVGIQGWAFDISQAHHLPSPESANIFRLSTNKAGSDISSLFARTSTADFPACRGSTAAYAADPICMALNGTVLTDCPLGTVSPATFATYGMTNETRRVGYGWEDMESGNYTNFMVLDGAVLNMNPYLKANPQPIAGDVVDLAIREQLASSGMGGRDSTMMFYTNPTARKAIKCLVQKYDAGHIDKITPGCFISNLVLYCSLVVILAIVLIRFFMAVFFSWFMAGRMASTPRPSRRRKVAPNVLPEGAMVSVNSSGAAPWANKQRPPPSQPTRRRRDSTESATPSVPDSLSVQHIGTEPYVVCLITAYSENEEGISTTLTSLSETEYSDQRKLLFLVADGMVTGSGETMSTPDVCVSLLDADPRFGTPTPMSFVSIGSGKKEHNMAMVYAGHYTRGKGRRTPMVVVVKCGAPDEAGDSKPGNRGKRDSQMILMNFFQRVTYNDRMTPLDYDLFRKVHTLMGVTPDFFELCLMVDADTMVYPKSMKTLANCMMGDPLIMGACGETRIANKTQTWVTMIQVYEYFISHHQAKAFESVFGGVTCLPGCFSMYRIKARKQTDDDWVPIIVKPEVTREYSQSVVTTLHQKNLLLLGEDRFLTTTLLRTFPNRKMVFCPEARCKTEVPHTFKMLLSQRRRWINSTIHNLMELVLVRDLCGTFCFSMQFVVFMDLLGTLVLPVSIALTYTLVVTYCLNPPHSFTEAIPLMLLVAVIGMPALLILLATRKVVYVLWMLIYLIALPVWNFVLPVYSFWHFDDFSWGETRKVEGEAKQMGHGDEGGAATGSAVPLRRWEDWERSRLRKRKREEKRRRELERQFGSGFHNDEFDGDGDRKLPGMPLSRRESDTFSDSVTINSDFDDDKWGNQIGGYDESLPPPVQIVRHSVWVGDQEVVIDTEDMEKMLETGWDDKAFRTKNMGKPGAQQPQYPSAVNRNRISQMGMFPANRDAPAVPDIPARYSRYVGGGGHGSNGHSNGSYEPGSYEMERTPSPGEYASLMRGGAPSPSSPGFGPTQPYGHSSAVQGGGTAGSHARQRSGGGVLDEPLLPPRQNGNSLPRNGGPPAPRSGPPGPPGPGRSYHDRFG
ncbi:Fungal chitin synthase [Kalmanozyma brasiliensis GHG001]|uniref:Fungal chitin synthase n=1 Tax=Kalmanozyma brasiliensis (strain GHG001) TaxID=1365824 RepID=UPI001CE874F1|nr:Fungal chitin synthase [Kalmanozyma brasiliensis GHG001]EST08287.2 Fungal chitin synthase [Kalmanozyma brasiliensis GHG001]